MPKLEFKGKSLIYAHHLTVSPRPLVPDLARSLNPVADDNLIIHGDNLHALKSLLPRYADKVKCIYIDPPYNTGSQAWIYNDNVNSPLMQEWLRENKPVDGEDLERHDKWLCMMWPRLQLLKELLADNGVIFVSIDDHEQHHLRMLLEDVFGKEQFVDTLVMTPNLGAFTGKWLRKVNEHIHVFAKDISQVSLGLFVKDVPEKELLIDDRGPYLLGHGLVRTSGVSRTPSERPNLYFPIFVGEDLSIATERQGPDDVPVYPVDGQGKAAVWMWGKEKITKESHNLLVKPHDRMGYQFIIKRRSNGSDGVFKEKPSSLWNRPEYAATNGTNTLKAIFDGRRVFDFPKSPALLEDIVRFSNAGPDDIILDSFAGSGTTAHAVLALNKEDGGNRKFILVECEDYADTITAERVRRVINGVPGTSDASLQEGLGGSFSYCTLGDSIEVDAMLTGEELPDYSRLARFLLYAGHLISVDDTALNPKNDAGLFYSTDKKDYYLIYEPDVDRLCRASLTAELAKEIGVANCESGKESIVWAPDSAIGQRALADWGITFCQIPYEMFRTG